jgi:hypothetical protein
MPHSTKRPLTEAGHEQIKLRANYLNGIGIATFAVGTLGPLAKALLEIPSGRSALIAGGLFALICLVASGILHFLAYRHLKEMDR